MRKKIVFLLAALLMTGLLTGCGGEDEEKTVELFYMNMDSTKITGEDYVPEAEGGLSLANELLQKLQSEPESEELRQTIPQTVTVNGCSYSGYALIVDFSEEYYNMGMTEEVLVRAAVVKTLVQINGFSSVSFTVNSEPLKDASGDVVGVMSAESFVENPGQQINTSIEATLTLYFASSDGTALVKETRSVHYSSNISLDKLVVEQLIEGPETSGLLATIPSETRPINISTVEGVCYVSLDETFQNQNTEVTEQVVLYSIVNSLAELPDVEKVQISINGDTSGKVRYEYDLSVMYEPDESLLEGQESVEMEDTEE